MVTEADKVPITTIKRIKTIAWWILPFCIDVTGRVDKNIYVWTEYIYFIYLWEVLKKKENNETVPVIVFHIRFSEI